MPIEYINFGAAKSAAAEKIKLVIQEKRIAINPFVKMRVLPEDSEAIKLGGGKYRFSTILGFEKAARRTTTPTNSTVSYNGKTDTDEVVLTVSLPLETKKYPYSNQDTIEFDGINFPARASGKIGNTLIKAEIEIDQSTIYDNANINLIDGSAKTKTLDKLILIKETSAVYRDINETDTPDMAKYFDGGTYTYEKDDAFIYLNPSDVTEFSNVNTEAGAGSSLQFVQFEQGQLNAINGFKVIETRYAKKGMPIITPINVLGVPDEVVMNTKIIAYHDQGNDIDVVWGKHYYDSILVAPELVTVIDFNVAPAPPAAEAPKSLKTSTIAKKEIPQTEVLQTEIEKNLNNTNIKK